MKATTEDNQISSGLDLQNLQTQSKLVENNDRFINNLNNSTVYDNKDLYADGYSTTGTENYRLNDSTNDNSTSETTNHVDTNSPAIPRWII